MLLQYTKNASLKSPSAISTSTAGWDDLFSRLPKLAARFATALPIDEHLRGLYADRDAGERREYRLLLRLIGPFSFSLEEKENEIWCRLAVPNRTKPLAVKASLAEVAFYLSRTLRNGFYDQQKKRPALLEIHESELRDLGRDAEAKDLIEQLPAWISRRYSKEPRLGNSLLSILRTRGQDGTLGQQDLARRLGVHQATISRGLKRLREEMDEYLAEGPAR